MHRPLPCAESNAYRALGSPRPDAGRFRRGTDRQNLVRGVEPPTVSRPSNYSSRAIGHKGGKDEAWLVLDAKPYAVIGLELRREVSRDELRAASLSGAFVLGRWTGDSIRTVNAPAAASRMTREPNTTLAD